MFGSSQFGAPMFGQGPLAIIPIMFPPIFIDLVGTYQTAVDVIGTYQTAADLIGMYQPFIDVVGEVE